MIKVELLNPSDIHTANHQCTHCTTWYTFIVVAVVVSFRGTHNIADWLDDLDAVQTAYPKVDNGYVHKGFYSAWKDDLRSSVMHSVAV